MLTFKNADIHGIIQKNLGHDATAIDFLPFPDLEQSVIDDVAKIKASPLVRKGTPITGWIYDVTSGKLKTVVTDES
jgi:carbonic anhydrase